MSPEVDLSKQEVEEAKKYGGTDAFEDTSLEPKNTLSPDDPNHLERSTAHSPNHAEHLKRVRNGRKSVPVEPMIEQELKIAVKEKDFIKRRRNGKHPRE